jgi:hypothetical protein
MLDDTMAMRNPYLAFNVMVITNPPLDRGVWNSVWKQILSIPNAPHETYFHILRITNFGRYETLRLCVTNLKK